MGHLQTRLGYTPGYGDFVCRMMGLALAWPGMTGPGLMIFLEHIQFEKTRLLPPGKNLFGTITNTEVLHSHKNAVTKKLLWNT